MNDPIDYDKYVMSYYHGDFNFNKLFKTMGDELVAKIIKENKESKDM